MVPVEGTSQFFQVESVWINHFTEFADQRKNLFDFDQVLNTQRENVYGSRRQALLAEDLGKKMVQLAEKTSDDILEVPLLLPFYSLLLPLSFTFSTLLSANVIFYSYKIGLIRISAESYVQPQSPSIPICQCKLLGLFLFPSVF